MLKMSYAGYPNPSPAILVQFSRKMCDTAGNCKKNSLKPSILGLKVINVDTNKKLLTIACYDKQHVCAYLQLFSRYTR